MEKYLNNILKNTINISNIRKYIYIPYSYIHICEHLLRSGISD